MDDFDDFLNSVASPPVKTAATASKTVPTIKDERMNDATQINSLSSSTYDNSNYDLDFLNDSPIAAISSTATTTNTTIDVAAMEMAASADISATVSVCTIVIYIYIYIFTLLFLFLPPYSIALSFPTLFYSFMHTHLHIYIYIYTYSISLSGKNLSSYLLTYLLTNHF